MTWQPIETAPKDGTRILLAFTGGFAIVAQWDKSIHLWLDDPYEKKGFSDDDFSYWLAFPEPPQ